MAAPSGFNAANGDIRWDKQYAPKISRKQVILVSAIYGIWLLFLAALSIERWFFSFQ
ncbi:MAG TPA: hypothetical protein VNT79_04490 [Phycisphaerae bacterium]|nr:hypothetical protein [Phycisphaerae bacterium]